MVDYPSNAPAGGTSYTTYLTPQQSYAQLLAASAALPADNSSSYSAQLGGTTAAPTPTATTKTAAAAAPNPVTGTKGAVAVPGPKGPAGLSTARTAEAVNQAKSFLAARAGPQVDLTRMQPVTALRLASALADAEAATGASGLRTGSYPGVLNSGFRSVEEQRRIYNSGVRPAAPPGRSQHNIGLAADFNRGPLLSFMRSNAADYGLSTLGTNRRGGPFDEPHLTVLAGRSVDSPFIDQPIVSGTGVETATGPRPPLRVGDDMRGNAITPAGMPIPGTRPYYPGDSRTANLSVGRGAGYVAGDAPRSYATGEDLRAYAADAPARSSAAKLASTGGAYVMKPGDTLISVAKTVYGDGKKYRDIARASGIPLTEKAFRSIRPGTRLTLPGLADNTPNPRLRPERGLGVPDPRLRETALTPTKIINRTPIMAGDPGPPFTYEPGTGGTGVNMTPDAGPAAGGWSNFPERFAFGVGYPGAPAAGSIADRSAAKNIPPQFAGDGFDAARGPDAPQFGGGFRADGPTPTDIINRTPIMAGDPGPSFTYDPGTEDASSRVPMDAQASYPNPLTLQAREQQLRSEAFRRQMANPTQANVIPWFEFFK